MALQGTKPERYSKIIDFYEKGEANANDFLLTDLVEWPERLDIVRPPNFPVEFKSSWSDIYAYIRLLPGPTNILFTYLLMRQNMAMGLSFLAATTFKRAISLGGYVKPKSKPNTVHLNPLFRIAEKSLHGRRFVSTILSHEYKHVLQARDMNESLSSALQGDRLGITHMLSDDTTKHVKYLAHEAELQARMHTLIIGAYHQYRMVPIDRAELFYVLKKQGVRVPKHILKKHDTPRIRHSYKHYKRYADDDAVSDINNVLKCIKDDRQDDFWERVIPFVYGDMLELWGDRLGHKRMGHTHNVQLREVFYRSAEESAKLVRAFQLSSSNENETQTRQEIAAKIRDMRSVLQIMDSDDATNLACMLIGGVEYQEYGESDFIAHHHTNITHEALKAIMGRNDLTVHQHAKIQKSQRNHGTTHLMKAHDYSSVEERLGFLEMTL